MARLKLSNTINLEVNGKAVEEKTQEIFVFKNEKGEFIKRVKNSSAYFFPKDENGVPILDWQDHMDYYREKYQHSRLFEDLINKNKKK